MRHLSENCKFGASLEERLRDKLVSGLGDDRMVNRLLSEEDTLTFAKACEICLQMEQNRKDAKKLLNGDLVNKTSFVKLNKNKNEYKPYPQRKPDGERRSQFKCYRCNGTNHKPDACYFKTKNCNFCKKLGHKESVCRIKGSQGNQIQRQRRQVKHVAEDAPDTSEDDEEYQIMTVNGSNGRKIEPIMVVLDLNNNVVRMEVDTGAAATLISQNTFNKINDGKLILRSSDHKLIDYSGNRIPVEGSINLPVKYHDQEKILTAIVVTAGSDVLGRDWLSHLKLKWKELFPVKEIGSVDNNWPTRFPQIFSDTLGTYTDPKVHIAQIPGSNPVFLRERNLPLAIKSKVKHTIDEMVKEGILTPTEESQWATTIVPVLKPDGSVRVCGDYRETVNKSTACQSYPLPTLDNMLHKLAQGSIFTKLDLSQAYLQLSLDEETSKMCTINTPFGLFRVNRLPYGVSSSPAIFQRTMETLLKDVENVVVYIDDIVVYGKTVREHNETLQVVLEKLARAGLVLKKGKCKWNQDSIVFLGHIIDRDGIRPMKAKVEAIQKMRPPNNVSELRKVLGMINYYHKFLPSSAIVLEPLHKLLRKDIPWMWGEQQCNAFKKIKELLSSTTVLTHFDPRHPIVLTVDASPYGIGAILSHRKNGIEHPVGFVSRSLNSAEKNYSQTELEALAIIFGILKFQSYLFGHHFTIETDYRPLIGLFGKGYATSKIAAGRITRWCIYLNQFDFELVYKPGTQISHADTLSRFPVSEPPEKALLPSETINLIKQLETTTVTFEKIAEETKKDKCLTEVMHYTRTRWPDEISSELKPYRDRQLELSIQQGCLMWGQRVVIPTVLRDKIVKILHEGHIGIAKMKALGRSFVY